MSTARRRDTAPELALRRALHAAGLRYRVAYPVPGQRRRTIDVAFTRLQLAVFVDGCFWHGCPAHGTDPRANAAWWRAKISANQARDRDTDQVLADLGWSVLRFWEHVPASDAARIVRDLVPRLRPGAPVYVPASDADALIEERRRGSHVDGGDADEF